VIEWQPPLERPPPIAQNGIGRLASVLLTGMKVGTLDLPAANPHFKESLQGAI
jgi:hypothetical protein